MRPAQTLDVAANNKGLTNMDREATFQMGDWGKPHRLTTAPVEGDHPDLGVVECSCGWSCMTEKALAKQLGKVHLERAKARQ